MASRASHTEDFLDIISFQALGLTAVGVQRQWVQQELGAQIHSPEQSLVSRLVPIAVLSGERAGAQSEGNGACPVAGAKLHGYSPGVGFDGVLGQEAFMPDVFV